MSDFLLALWLTKATWLWWLFQGIVAFCLVMQCIACERDDNDMTAAAIYTAIGVALFVHWGWL